MSMEANKDEAVRAREIAERKLASQDYQGALKFAQKAQQLFPALESMAQMFAVIEVHIAAQAKVNGTETDWYGILQVPPQADDLLIKKQYRKLALLLHPDKNKLAGAEAAFKLIGEASQILSDKQKRQVHDAKRAPPARTTQRAKSTQHRQSHAHQSNGQPYLNRQQPRIPPQNLLPTFWTACPSCHMRFQYLRTYENQNLLCAQCRNPFIARDIYFPQGNGAYNAYGWTPIYQQQHQAFNQSSSQPFAPGFNPANNFMAGSNMHTSFSDGVNTGANTTNVPGMGEAKPGTESVQQEAQPGGHVKENVDTAELEQKRKRERKEEVRKEKEAEKEQRKVEREQQKKAKADLRAQEAIAKLKMKRKELEEKASAKVKRRKLKKHHSDSSNDDDDEDDSLDDSLSDDQGMDATLESKLHPRRSSRVRRNVTYKMDASDDEDPQGGGVEDDDDKASATPRSEETKKPDKKSEKGAQNGNASLDMAKKLADFAKNKIRMNLNLQGKSTSSPSDYEFQAAKAHESLNEDKGVPVREGNVRSHLNKPEEPEADEQEESKEEIDEPAEEPEQFSVPDADFHDFDKDREEKDIWPGQIWAAYDEQDGMPRYYCKVKDVQSRKPFKATINWLELQNLSEMQEEMKEMGYCCTCGSSFKTSESQVIDSVNMLSHLVKWEKGMKGMARIYPREKDVWALYRDWEPDLGFMKGESSVKYDMVEVLNDFSEQVGVEVAYLDKMSAFKTLFKRREGSIFVIPAAELSRFSHQVPAHTMQGDEAPGIVKGCWELDPASVPIDLIVPSSNEQNSGQ